MSIKKILYITLSLVLFAFSFIFIKEKIDRNNILKEYENEVFYEGTSGDLFNRVYFLKLEKSEKYLKGTFKSIVAEMIYDEFELEDTETDFTINISKKKGESSELNEIFNKKVNVLFGEGEVKIVDSKNNKTLLIFEEKEKEEVDKEMDSFQKIINDYNESVDVDENIEKLKKFEESLPDQIEKLEEIYNNVKDFIERFNDIKTQINEFEVTNEDTSCDRNSFYCDHKEVFEVIVSDIENIEDEINQINDRYELLVKNFSNYNKIIEKKSLTPRVSYDMEYVTSSFEGMKESIKEFEDLKEELSLFFK